MGRRRANALVPPYIAGINMGFSPLKMLRNLLGYLSVDKARLGVERLEFEPCYTWVAW